MPNSSPVSTPRSGTAPLLELRAVSAAYPKRSLFSRSAHLVLKDIQLELFRGEVVALVGESGSGKSTILKLIARLLAPSSGSLFWRGQNLSELEPKQASLSYRGEVQMVFQDPFASLNPFHTLGYTLSRPLLRHGLAHSRQAASEQAAQLLEDVGLTPGREFIHKHPYELSGGQRQRVVIARALAVQPSVILADEPVSMLDVSIRIGILNLLDDLRQTRNISYLFVTHDLASARYLADRIVVLYQGEVMEQGPSEALLRSPAHPYTRLLFDSAPKADATSIAAACRPHPVHISAPELAPEKPKLPGSACSFAPRCPKAQQRCWVESPALNPVTWQRLQSESWVRCHFPLKP
jgi:peptide/nickel transport system ATP-binding protein